MSSSTIVPTRGSMSSAPSRKALATSRGELPGGQAKAETLPIGHLQAARHEYEAHQQDQHAHAAGDA